MRINNGTTNPYMNPSNPITALYRGASYEPCTAGHDRTSPGLCVSAGVLGRIVPEALQTPAHSADLPAKWPYDNRPCQPRVCEQGETPAQPDFSPYTAHLLPNPKIWLNPQNPYLPKADINGWLVDLLA